MIIAMNAISAKTGGIYTYTKNLIKEFQNYKEHSFHIWVPQDSDFESAANVTIHKCEASEKGIFQRVLYEQFKFPKELKGICAEVLFSSANFGLIKSPVPQLLLIRKPQYFSKLYLEKIWPRLPLEKRFQMTFRRALIKKSARKSDVVLFPSHSMEKSYRQLFNDKKSKTKVLYYGTPFKFIGKSREQKDLPAVPNLLYVSVYYAHKNPGVLAEAIPIMEKRGLDTNTTITMDMDSDHAKSFITWKTDSQKLNSPQLKEKLILGSIPYQQIQKAYEKADYFIFPSFVESFGHPMIEAMANGLPIVAADTEINREICGKAAIYFDPFDPNDLTDKIIKIHNDLPGQNKLISNAEEQIKRYKWRNYVQDLIELLTTLQAERGKK